MSKIILDKLDLKTLVLTMVVLPIVDRGHCLRRQCHVQTDKQTYLELACDKMGLDYSADYFYMDVPTHGPMNHIQDSPVPVHNYTGKSNDTLPAGFLIDQSSIEFAGMGVFTLKDLPLLTIIGPYDGVIVPIANENESTLVYAWEIEQDGAYHHLMDGQDESRANWMRYINSPNKEEGANMKAYQSKGYMMYRTLKHIPPCTELLVWYGDNYGKYLDELREEREAGNDAEEEEKGEKESENDSENEGAEGESDYDEENDLSDVSDEETNSNDSDSNDIDKNNGDENKSEKGAFVSDIYVDETVETKIEDQNKYIKDTKITCDATKPDGKGCMKPESNMYKNENGNDDL